MDARNNGDGNPFDNSLYCLEWIASAIDAARRHNEQRAAERRAETSPDSAPGPRALSERTD